MKKRLVCSLIMIFLLMFWTGAASALYTMEVIGTAEFIGITDTTDPRYEKEYNLIWDPDNNGNSLVWLDYTNDNTNWDDQRAWAAGLDNALDITVYSGYSVNWTDSSWRLPSTVDGESVYGTDGTTTAGYNITTSEMGHLYYTELGNKGYYDINGNIQSVYAVYGLKNTEDFNNLTAYSWYWSGTEYEEFANDPNNPDGAWGFSMDDGYQNYNSKSGSYYGLAVRSGQVSTAPIPEPTTSLLLGIGLLGLAGITRCRKGSRC